MKFCRDHHPILITLSSLPPSQYYLKAGTCHKKYCSVQNICETHTTPCTSLCNPLHSHALSQYGYYHRDHCWLIHCDRAQHIPHPIAHTASTCSLQYILQLCLPCRKHNLRDTRDATCTPPHTVSRGSDTAKHIVGQLSTLHFLRQDCFRLRRSYP